jgi:adenosylcobinamide-GDP ribazoletransferase
VSRPEALETATAAATAGQARPARLAGPIGHFLAALGFLSRLAPARVLPEADMRRAMFHLPLCGLAIGLCACAPALAGLFAGRPSVQAWTVLALSAWLTRGLHLDGISDVADAMAAHVDRERFWTIIKDSRSGAFGVAALVLTLLGQAALYGEILRQRPAWALAWVFVFGRACGVVVGLAGRPLARPGLGGVFLSGATMQAALWALFAALAPAVLLWPAAGVFALAAAVLLLLPLVRLAWTVGGLNGDFLGAAIVLGEIAAAAGLVLAQTP